LLIENQVSGVCDIMDICIWLYGRPPLSRTESWEPGSPVLRLILIARHRFPILISRMSDPELTLMPTRGTNLRTNLATLGLKIWLAASFVPLTNRHVARY